MSSIFLLKKVPEKESILLYEFEWHSFPHMTSGRGEE